MDRPNIELEAYIPNQEIIGDYNESLAAKCENGTFVGYLDNNVLTWKGIPFAKQPVGELRFKQAGDPEPSDKVFEACHIGPACLQVITSDEPCSRFEQREECLTLNVWSNVDNKSARKPVLVFIHGGAWEQGGLADPVYQGRNFVYDNPEVLFVCITYRVGMMGLINLSSFPDGADYKTSTNNALLDQVQALRWIKRNISAFGGDPDDVTIMGESAGGGAVSSLCVLPQAKGLFKKAIPMSGGANQSCALEVTNELTEILIEKLGVKTVAELNVLPFDRIKDFWHETGLYCANIPPRDGIVLSDDPVSVWENGDNKEFIVMQGHTGNEFRYFQKVWYDMEDMYDAYCVCAIEQVKDNSPELFAEYLGKYYDILRKYGYPERELPWEYMNDFTLSCPNLYQAYHHSKNGGKSFFYIFNKHYDNPKYLRDSHAIDLYYLFGNFDGYHAIGTPEEKELSRKFQRMIVNFCLYDDPSIDECKWPTYDPENRMTMFIGDDIHVESNPQSERADIMIDMFKDIPLCRYTNPICAPYPLVEKNYPEIYARYQEALMEDCSEE